MKHPKRNKHLMEVGLEGETSKINLRTIHSYSGAGLKHMSR